MDPRVADELRAFVDNINKMTGITNSFDYNRCVEMFERLVAGAIPFDPEQIRVWLATQGELLPEDAKAVKAMAVKAMAEKFVAGRKVRHR